MTLEFSLKRVGLWLACILCIVAACLGARYQGHQEGLLEGIKAYHQQCFNVGGYVIDDTGHVVMCQGQGVVPKEELKNFKSTI